MKGVAKWLLRIVAAVALAVLLRGATLGIFVAGLYGTANWTDAWLDSAKPPRKTVDRRLWYCSKRPIEMKDSLWGRGYELQEGETCIQYRVFARPDWPIDVVYTPGHRVLHSFESYE